MKLEPKCNWTVRVPARTIIYHPSASLGTRVSVDTLVQAGTFLFDSEMQVLQHFGYYEGWFLAPLTSLVPPNFLLSSFQKIKSFSRFYIKINTIFSYFKIKSFHVMSAWWNLILNQLDYYTYFTINQFHEEAIIIQWK